MSATFQTKDQLIEALTIQGNHLVTYQNLPDYIGMSLAIMLVVDLEDDSYELDLQWMALGLDLYGDTLQETYLYKLKSLDQLLNYLEETYNIPWSQIPVKYKFDAEAFVSPITHPEFEAEYQEAWDRFQQDFAAGKFLDTACEVSFSSLEE